MEAEKCNDLAVGPTLQTSLSDTVKEMEETCISCNPLSMLTCIAGCNIWKLKNQFRSINKKMQSRDFMPHLMNVLKNKKRLEALEIISRNQITITKLQQELKKLNNYHGQETLAEDYVQPLIDVGLVDQDQSRYSATTFGQKISELIRRSPGIAEYLPAHSECHEETVLLTLLKEPKTRDALESIIPRGSIARVLSRLQSSELIERPNENDHIFFFRTQRNPNKEKLSPTEKRVYENVPSDGVSARRLAVKANITLRRTYMYLRRLKGKKLIFTREKTKSYALTDTGIQIATGLQCIQGFVGEVFDASLYIVSNEQIDAETNRTEQRKS
jgi:predicted transcriptional regulator